MTHRKEYIYYRTDHHWTALGAYYAYQQLCAAKGIEPEDLNGYETKEFDGFLGSFYNDTSLLEDELSIDTIDVRVRYEATSPSL